MTEQETLDQRIKENAASQLAYAELQFKRDCRIKALQLAERLSPKECDAIGVVTDAEILYTWLINTPADAVDIFQKSGVLSYPTNP